MIEDVCGVCGRGQGIVGRVLDALRSFSVRRALSVLYAEPVVSIPKRPPADCHWTGERDGDWDWDRNWLGRVWPIAGDAVHVGLAPHDITGGLDRCIDLSSLTIAPHDFGHGPRIGRFGS